jgi:predicted DCC family thiol-disulfide oxidoreductase YuxK
MTASFFMRIVPRFQRDAVYRLIARTRYRVWGRHAVCDLGGQIYADRIVTKLD